MKLLVLGGTGRCGKHVVQRALAATHQVTVFVRNPSKLPSEVASKVKIIQGTLTDEKALSTAVQGQDAIISTLGPSGPGYKSFSTYNGFFPNFYKLLLRVMREQKVLRILAITTTNVQDAKDQRSLTLSAIGSIAWLYGRVAWREFNEIGETFKTEGHSLDWTVFRVGIITDGKEGTVLDGYIGDQGSSVVISREGMAAWLVRQVETSPPQWVRQMPYISSV
ncbi:hypothetical protein B7463_g11938, partial [Scytalidium lignicola]